MISFWQLIFFLCVMFLFYGNIPKKIKELEKIITFFIKEIKKPTKSLVFFGNYSIVVLLHLFVIQKIIGSNPISCLKYFSFLCQNNSITLLI